MKKILITGGGGLVGSAFHRTNTQHELLFLTKKQVNLQDFDSFVSFIDAYKPDAVIHLAARVGGVKGNTDFVSDFYLENTRINCNVLDACNIKGIEKVVSLLSTCVYPDKASYPLTEDQLHLGPPHISNFGYAYSKRMLDVHSRCLRQQYKKNYVCAIPNNLYGINDNFDTMSGHVIPSLIRKVWEAKLKGNDEIEVWGDGTSLREFTYVDDIAKILLMMIDEYNDDMPLNVGNCNEMPIKYVVSKIMECLDYKGNVRYNSNMPSGQAKKTSSNKRLLEMTSWKESNYTSFDQGISKTCNWFKMNYPNVRGMQ